MGTRFALVCLMELFIKNMVCIRCKMIVKLELEKAGLYCREVELGRVVTTEYPTGEQIDKFCIALMNSGLELINNKKTFLDKECYY